MRFGRQFVFFLVLLEKKSSTCHWGVKKGTEIWGLGKYVPDASHVLLFSKLALFEAGRLFL